VFVEYSGEHPVATRIEQLLREAGLRVGRLRASVKLKDREAWIRRHAADYDVVISHPRLVETGLDLFDRGGAFNFSTLIFYETGYNLFTLRQASRRSWRIGQQRGCRVYYLYYAGTMQERAMDLMGRKLQASLALEGKFSSDGLAALADDGGSAEMELARSLVERLDLSSALPRTGGNDHGSPFSPGCGSPNQGTLPRTGGNDRPAPFLPGCGSTNQKTSVEIPDLDYLLEDWPEPNLQSTRKRGTILAQAKRVTEILADCEL
jgi:hypothetical protein